MAHIQRDPQPGDTTTTRHHHAAPPPPPPPVSRHELPCKGQEQTTLRHCTSTHDALAPPFFPKYAGDTRDTRAPRHPLVMNARRYPASLLATPVVWVSGLVTWCKSQTMESQDWLSSLQSLLFVLLCCGFCFVVCGRRCVCRGWCRRRRRAPSARLHAGTHLLGKEL